MKAFCSPLNLLACRHRMQLFCRFLCLHSLPPVPQAVQRERCCGLPQGHKSQPPCCKQVPRVLPHAQTPMCLAHCLHLRISRPWLQKAAGLCFLHAFFKTPHAQILYLVIACSCFWNVRLNNNRWWSVKYPQDGVYSLIWRKMLRC